MNFTTASIMNLTISSNNSIVPTNHCVSLKLDGQKCLLTFCGVTDPWNPRLSETVARLSLSLIIIIAMGGSGIAIFTLDVVDTFKRRFKDADGFVMKVKRVIFPFLGFHWNVVDAILDGIVFYKLERGLLISPLIHRNERVNNFIALCAVLGALQNQVSSQGFSFKCIRQTQVMTSIFFVRQKHALC